MWDNAFLLVKALGLLRGAYTPQVQEAVTRFSSRMPYREAREELALLWKVDICQILAGHADFARRRHERRLNTINENPQISPMTQIFLCTSAPLRLCAFALNYFQRRLHRLPPTTMNENTPQRTINAWC